MKTTCSSELTGDSRKAPVRPQAVARKGLCWGDLQRLDLANQQILHHCNADRLAAMARGHQVDGLRGAAPLWQQAHELLSPEQLVDHPAGLERDTCALAYCVQQSHRMVDAVPRDDR